MACTFAHEDLFVPDGEEDQYPHRIALNQRLDDRIRGPEWNVEIRPWLLSDEASGHIGFMNDTLSNPRPMFGFTDANTAFMFRMKFS